MGDQPHDLSDYISPEEIAARQKRAREERQLRLDWFLWLLVCILAMALLTPAG